MAVASIFVKIVGAIYKIPLYNDSMLGLEGSGIFQTTYNVYTLMLTISTAGIPAAMSRIVSSAHAKGNEKLVKRYFAVAMPAFIAVGVAAMLVMFLFADNLAGFMNNTRTAPGIRVLAPGVLFVCIISVYRGYAQGFENMIPTAVSQVIEVICKAAFGLVAAFMLVSLGYNIEYVSAGAIMGVTIGLGLCVPSLAWYKRKLDRGITLSDDTAHLPSKLSALGQLMKVSIPITLSASFMSLMTLIDNGIILERLQTALGLSERAANIQYGIFTRGQTIYTLPPSIILPVSVSVIPAIAAALARKQEGEAGVIMQSSVKLVNILAMPAAAGLMALAAPILMALYNDSRQATSVILTILGAATFFVCLQYITSAILQANGHERVALLTFPIGAAFKIALSYVLVGNPDIGIIGPAISTLVCFIVISTLNIVFIMIRVKEKLNFIVVFIKPLLCATVMAGAAFLTYNLMHWLGSGIVGQGRFAVILFLGVAILVGVAVYFVLIIATRTVTKEDMMLVPKGEKLAKILRIR